MENPGFGDRVFQGGAATGRALGLLPTECCFFKHGAWAGFVGAPTGGSGDVVITDASPSITMVLPTRQVVASTARALASSMVTTLTVAWMVSPGLTGARRLLAEIHRARPGQTIRDGGGDHARGQEAMRNPPAEGCTAPATTAPLSCSARAASASVAPVVRTSSTRTQGRPATPSSFRRGTRIDPRTRLARAPRPRPF